ncbi:integrase core domain-containing protein [Corynebacterium sp. HMSC28B08]|uniref:integrase core domain-containing protein n=1 Tax=Corynebacterium TaxID=1716 RepID=UPI00143CA9E9|nr:integrase core domain-containing protein [Corynebacterium sp. HMSC28B08]
MSYTNTLLTTCRQAQHATDDNPRVESSFATLKNDQLYSQVFASIEHVTQWVAEWVEFYNTRRHHPGLANFTPQSVLDGTWAVRNKYKQARFECNPTRYRHRRPVVAIPDAKVYFNTVNSPGDISNQTSLDMVATR